MLSTYLLLLPPMLVIYFASLMGNLDCSQIPIDWGYTHRNLITSFQRLCTRLGQLQDYILRPTFSIMFPIIPFSFPAVLLDHGNSAAVVLILMFNCSPISLNNSLLNSHPLWKRKRLGVPNIAIQCLKILSVITSFCFELIMAVALYLVA